MRRWQSCAHAVHDADDLRRRQLHRQRFVRRRRGAVWPAYDGPRPVDCHELDGIHCRLYVHAECLSAPRRRGHPGSALPVAGDRVRQADARRLREHVLLAADDDAVGESAAQRVPDATAADVGAVDAAVDLLQGSHAVPDRRVPACVQVHGQEGGTVRTPASAARLRLSDTAKYPGWGAPKIREKLRQQFTGPHLPAVSTVHAVLDRYHLVKHRRRRRPRHTGTELSRPSTPNALWCADSKGEFMLGNRRYCYPLTITDFASRYLLTREALSTTQVQFAFTVFERAFKEFGLPAVIRTDNGVPFASAHALYGLSKLSVWWLRLGIQIERIQPGQPHQAL